MHLAALAHSQQPGPPCSSAKPREGISKAACFPEPILPFASLSRAVVVVALLNDVKEVALVSEEFSQRLVHSGIAATMPMAKLIDVIHASNQVQSVRKGIVY